MTKVDKRQVMFDLLDLIKALGQKYEAGTIDEDKCLQNIFDAALGTIELYRVDPVTD